jgi:molybdopterin converting factor small subunit
MICVLVKVCNFRFEKQANVKPKPQTADLKILPTLIWVGKPFISFIPLYSLFTTMSNLLNHYKNILAGYKTAVVDDVKDKLFGEKNQNEAEDTTSNIINPDTEYFDSLGYKIGTNTIKRYIQAQKDYGMECNATTLMYALQSYGLIPYNMSRVEFEIAFTPLHSDRKKEGKQKEFRLIHVYGTSTAAEPFDMFSAILDESYNEADGTFEPVSTSVGYVSKTEAILRGANKGVDGSILHTKLAEIVTNFKKQAENKVSLRAIIHSRNYSPFLKNAINNNNNFRLVDLSEKLKNGLLPKVYFTNGHTVIIGVSYHAPYSNSVGHYVPVVKEHIDTFSVNNQQYYIYPVDDPWFKCSCVVAPYMDFSSFNSIITDNKKKIRKDSYGKLYYENNYLVILALDYAKGLDDDCLR